MSAEQGVCASHPPTTRALKKLTLQITQADPLKTDCSKCAALCCVALAFDQSHEFAFSKNPGEPCRNLSGHQCSIHSKLTDDGFSGCVAYDCLGAGNRVVQEVFSGRSWQQDPRLIAPMIEAFAAMREVHKRIDFLRAAHNFVRDAEDDQRRGQLLDQLENEKWDEEALNQFQAGLALDVDMFMYQVKECFPSSLVEELFA